MQFEEDPRFTKELKKLKKKYRSLDDDFKLFKKILQAGVPINRHTTILYKNEESSIIKSRLFCKYLKGSSLRIVLIFYKIETKIVFIELFFKGDKEREDNVRIKEYSK